MRISLLSINNFRNLTKTRLDLQQGLNIVYGSNGSGKTSLLEAIYFLARGKSFRSNHVRKTLTLGETMMRVSANTVSNSKIEESIGIEFRDQLGRLLMKSSGRQLERSSQLAQLLPLIFIHQESHQLVSSSPKYRRKFLDWGVFHVEHGYLSHWQRYRRTLQQRNAALRIPGQDPGVWNDGLASSGNCIDIFRKQYIEIFYKYFISIVDRLLGISEGISFCFYSGWPEDKAFAMVLDQEIDRDRSLGYTRNGPHRADLQFHIEGRPIYELLSRGQQKLWVYSMYLAQAETFKAYTGEDAVIIADDLTAEIDRPGVTRLMEIVRHTSKQAIVTMLERHDGIISEDCVFHVEQGNISVDD